MVGEECASDKVGVAAAQGTGVVVGFGSAVSTGVGDGVALKEDGGVGCDFLLGVMVCVCRGCGEIGGGDGSGGGKRGLDERATGGLGGGFGHGGDLFLWDGCSVFLFELPGGDYRGADDEQADSDGHQ